MIETNLRPSHVELLAELNQADPSLKALTDFTLPDLIEKEHIDWDAVKITFHTQKDVFEQALFKLHYKRKKTFPALQKENILRFLTIGYISTNDVRYFNEFLWFYKEEDKLNELEQVCQSHFRKNLNTSKRHSFPLASVAEVNTYLDKHRLEEEVPFNKDMKVCLIGFPPFFSKIIQQLTKAGFRVEQYFIPFHPNKHVRRVLSNPLFVKGISLLKRNRYKYRTLNYHHSDPHITPILSAGKFDIGFHKLNFIIKKNVFGAFNKGLINDHWAVLPYLRGKSTIAYTLLFGFPMACTMHLIEQGVDTGKIIGCVEYDVNGIYKINAVRDKIRSTLPDRAVRAIKQLSVPGFELIDNTFSGGLTYYEIHPWLFNFIEKEIISPAHRP